MNCWHKKKTMTESLLFNQVRIRGMYGADFDLHLLDLSNHLNIIFGPNGAGKTTIANALNGLLLPSVGRKLRLYASAHLQYGQRTLDLDVKHTRAECRIDGKKVDKSKLSPFIRPKSYHLSLQELLPEKSDDSDLAEDIIRQANGGFDITAAGKKLGFYLQQRYNKTTEATEYETAARRLQEVRSEQRGLQEQKNQRENILSELNTAKRAGERAQLIEKILRWRNAEEEFQKAAALANRYPSIIQSSYNLDDAVTNAQELANNITRLKKDLDTQRSTIENIRKNLDRNQLSPDGLESGELQLLSSRVRDYSTKYRELEQLQETLEAAKEQVGDAWKKLGGLIEQGTEPDFAPEDLQHLQNFAKESGSFTHKQQALEQLKILFETVDAKEEGPDLHEIQSAQQIILQWILSLQNDSPKLRMVTKSLWVALFISLNLSVALGISVHPVGLAGILVSLLIGWILFFLRSGKQELITSSQKDHLKQILPELPQNPDIAALQSGLDQLIQKHSQRHLDSLKSQELLRHRRYFEKNLKQQSELEAQKKELIQSLNVTPPEDITSLIEFVDRILDWRRADRKAKELESRCNVVSENYNILMEATGDLFDKHGYDRPTDPWNAESLLEELRNDNDTAKRDRDRLIQEENRLESAENQIKDEEPRYAQVFTDLELELGDLSGLAECARQFSEWSKASSHSNELRIRAESLRPDQDIPAESKSLLELEDLEGELQLALQEFETAKSLQEQLTRLDASIERAERGSSLENALADLEKKRVALENVRQEKASKAVGQAILDSLRENAIKNAPPVFQRAEKNFKRVTDERYTLIIPQDNRFRARDNQRGLDFDLTELSSATRVQLLLSVRLAFVETHETSFRLPITLDETLANSDDHRAHAIIRTMSTLAADRQIFYFTAQQDEVDKWRDFVPENLLKVHSIG